MSADEVPVEVLDAEAAEYDAEHGHPAGQRLSPRSELDLEEHVLAALLTSPSAVEVAVAAGLEPGHLYRPQHRSVYTAILAATRAGHAVTDATGPNRAVLAAHGHHDGDLVADLATKCVGTTNVSTWADLIVAAARDRDIEEAATALADAARCGEGVEVALAALHGTAGRPTRSVGDRLAPGGSFVLDASSTPAAVWGDGDRVLWAAGEPLLIVGGSGVGKSTLAGQVVRARLGLDGEVLGLPVTADDRRVLYLAMDRPAQLRRSLRRQFTPADRQVLDDRLVVWEGPPSRDMARHPGELYRLAQRCEAGTIVIDSLKDAAVGLNDDEVGAGLNRALQECVAHGVEVLGLHHQRKGQNGAKPTSLEDVYGSTWIVAGAGSVVLLWGRAGDPIVELRHLKQPAEEVGPIRVEHHATTGTSTVYRGFDVLSFLTNRGATGATATDTARAMTEKDTPTDNERKKAQRQLDRLVAADLAVRDAPGIGGSGGSSGAVYRVTETPR